MATTDRQTPVTESDRVVGVLQEAEFLTVLARADGPGAAAAGLLADAATATRTPFQVCLVQTVSAAEERAENVDDATSVLSLGHPMEDGDQTVVGDAIVEAAYEAALAVGADPDPAVALAGMIAGGRHPVDLPSAQSEIHERGHRRQPGIASPGVDLAEALAYSTLYHGPPSGLPEEADELLRDLGSDPDGRAVASAVALAVAGQDERPASTADTVERFLHPLVTDAEWGSVEALADLLEATARMQPGRAVTLALGDGDLSNIRDVWRDHGEAVHTGVRDASIARYDGVVEASTQAPGASAARLIRDCRSPEPAVLVLGDQEIALATTEADARSTLSSAADNNEVGGHSSLAVARTETPEETARAVRERL